MTSTSDPIDAVILTALDIEANTFSQEFSEYKVVESRFRRYSQGLIGQRRVVVWSMETMGNAASAVAARQAITLRNPASLILAGIAGGTKAQDRHLGDVLVAEQLVHYEPAELRDKSKEIRWEVYRPSHEFLVAARTVASHDWWKDLEVIRPDGSTLNPRVHIGVLASGEKVISTAEWANSLLTYGPKAVGVEMEGIGVALATRPLTWMNEGQRPCCASGGRPARSGCGRASVPVPCRRC